MSRKISLGTALLIVLLAVLVTFNITYLSVNNKFSDQLQGILSDYDAYTKLASVMKLIEENYIGEVDAEKMADALMNGYIAGIEDKYARYLDKEAYAQLVADQNASLVGIGIVAQYESSKEAILVCAVMPDSPAEKVGVKPGDLIVAIDSISVADEPYEQAANRLRGEIGTVVTLTVIRDELRRMEYSVTRDKVTTLSVYPRILTDAEGEKTEVGYLYISGFDSQTPAQFTKAITDLQSQGAGSFIFDLRGNPGGELNSVTKVLDSLLPEGPIVRMYDKAGKETVISSDESCMEIEACVLVDRKSASAAELFTAALQDYSAKGLFDATVIGSQTYGKGTVQSVFRLSDETAISISTRTYSPPYSENYEGKGVTPDVELPLNETAANVSIYLRDHLKDNQIMHAVELLQAA